MVSINLLDSILWVKNGDRVKEALISSEQLNYHFGRRNSQHG
jgi:hypothetical protein